MLCYSERDSIMLSSGGSNGYANSLLNLNGYFLSLYISMNNYFNSKYDDRECNNGSMDWKYDFEVVYPKNDDAVLSIIHNSSEGIVVYLKNVSATKAFIQSSVSHPIQNLH